MFATYHAQRLQGCVSVKTLYELQQFCSVMCYGKLSVVCKKMDLAGSTTNNCKCLDTNIE